MTLTEIADELIAGCREARARENLARLYHSDAVSVEAADMGNGREARGLAAIEAKHIWWDENHDVHEMEVDGPYPHGDDRFALVFEMEATNKATGERLSMEEVAVYYVSDGKIIREEFFYPTGA